MISENTIVLMADGFVLFVEHIMREISMQQ